MGGRDMNGGRIRGGRRGGHRGTGHQDPPKEGSTNKRQKRAEKIRRQKRRCLMSKNTGTERPQGGRR